MALVCDRLANIGEHEQVRAGRGGVVGPCPTPCPTPPLQAGELYLRVDMVKEALDMLMAGGSWEKARHISKNVHPQ